MPTKKRAPAAANDPAVEAFVRDLDHPLKPVVEALRRLVRGVDPSVGEAIKWKAPSFVTTDHFATFNLRASDRVLLILHTGAKSKAAAKAGLAVADPAGVLEWLAPDRAVVTVRDLADLAARGGAITEVLRAWVAVMRTLQGGASPQGRRLAKKRQAAAVNPPSQ